MDMAAEGRWRRLRREEGRLGGKPLTKGQRDGDWTFYSLFLNRGCRGGLKVEETSSETGSGWGFTPVD